MKIKPSVSTRLVTLENQKGLLEQIEIFFEVTSPYSVATQHEIDYGRIETRTCSAIDNLKFFDDYKDWPGLKTLVRVESTRTIKSTKKEAHSIRYYISSKKVDAEVINKDIRSHWAIENKLHWVLDVTFKEDASRKRKGDSAANSALMSKIALTRIEKCDLKKSRSLKRAKAALSDKYREKLLAI